MFYLHFKSDGSSAWAHTIEHFEAAQEYSRRAPDTHYDRCFEIETNSQTEANAVYEAVAALIAHGVRPEARSLRSRARVREIQPFA